MKKFTSLFSMIVLTALNVQSQTVLYSNNFDSYAVGSYMAVQDPTWFRTWTNAPGTGEDALTSNAFSKSPTKSVLVDETGGATDLLLKLGDKTTGTFELKWMMYVESGNAGFYNIQHFQTPGAGDEYAMRVFFRTNGNGELNVGGAYYPFNYPKDSWFEVKHLIDLDANTIKYYVNGIMVKEWPFNYQINSTSGTKQLGGVDFFAGVKSGSGETPKYFFDDLSFRIMLTAEIQSPDWFWAKSIGGTGDETGISTVDASGNVFTTGSFTGTIDFDPGTGTFNLTSAGGSDIFVTKTDAAGNFVWAKRIGGTGDDAGASLTIDVQGYIYVTGHFTGTVDFDPGTGTFNLTSAGYDDAFISKLDKLGNFVYAKKMGGIGNDAIAEGYSIALDNLGNVFTTGAFAGTVDFDPGTGLFNITAVGIAAIYVSKLDREGNFIWTKAMGGSYSLGNYIAIDGSGNVYSACHSEGTVDFDPGLGIFNLTPPAGNKSGVISKLDASGNFVWAKQMDKTEIFSLVIDASDNIYSTGSFTGTVDFDPGTGIFNLTSAGDYDIFISKLNSSGDFVFAKGMGGIGYDEGTSIALDNDGNIYTTGVFGGTADFDPGIGSFNLTSKGANDIFVSKSDNLGNFVWAKAAGGTGFDWSRSIALDALGNIYLSGGFSPPSILFGSIALTNAENSGYNHDIFSARLGNIITSIASLKKDDDISVYPNPTDGKFTIVSKSNISSIEIYNLSGARIYSDFNFKKHTLSEIDLTGYAKGIYLLIMYDGAKIQSRKVIVQ
jgi:hypothetical protein